MSHILEFFNNIWSLISNIPNEFKSSLLAGALSVALAYILLSGFAMVIYYVYIFFAMKKWKILFQESWGIYVIIGISLYFAISISIDFEEYGVSFDSFIYGLFGPFLSLSLAPIVFLFAGGFSAAASANNYAWIKPIAPNLFSRIMFNITAPFISLLYLLFPNKKKSEFLEKIKSENDDIDEPINCKYIIISILCIIIIFLIFVGGPIINNQKEIKKEATADLKNMAAEVKNLNCYYNQYEPRFSNGCYHIEICYELSNCTGVDWLYLELGTNVYLKGSLIGNITTRFGEQYNDSSGFRINVGESKLVSSELTCGIKENDDFFEAMYDNYQDLSFETEVKHGMYYEN